MSAINFSIRRDLPILCPGCLVELAGPVGYVIGNMVFCHRCAAILPDVLLKRILRRPHLQIFSGLFHSDFGLTVLSPPRTIGRDRLKLLHTQLSADPDEQPFYLHCHRPFLIDTDIEDLPRPLTAPATLPPPDPLQHGPAKPSDFDIPA